MILYRRATTNGSPVPYEPRIDAYCFCGDRLGNNGNIHIVNEVEVNLHFLCPLAAGFIRSINDDLFDVLVHTPVTFIGCYPIALLYSFWISAFTVSGSRETMDSVIDSSLSLKRLTCNCAFTKLPFGSKLKYRK